jgi:hypothetical protein
LKEKINNKEVLTVDPEAMVHSNSANKQRSIKIIINTEYALGARRHPNSTEDLGDRITTMQDSINPNPDGNKRCIAVQLGGFYDLLVI